jgi:ATP-dependent helicase/nuclease subunit A
LPLFAYLSADEPLEAVPPDHHYREQIVRELDKSVLVEAAAGTGKTTCMVDRMVALLREGKCTTEHLAAVTFTRKAAAELRSRFQIALESHARTAQGVAAKRLGQAVAEVDRCFIGTIHSFCARLLRERPVEAGVDLGFQELDEERDLELRIEAWDEYVAAMFADNHPLLAEARELGLEIKRLRSTFVRFADYIDVGDWPTSQLDLPDLKPVSTKLREYAEDIALVAPTFPAERGSDKLMETYELIMRMTRQTDLTRPAELMEVLERCKPCDIAHKYWPGKGSQAKEEAERWEMFCSKYAQPLATLWRQKRYASVLPLLLGAVENYDRLRQKASSLSYQDLLLKAAALLRDKQNQHIRRYFRKRFSHLLVDEFQDTDPIQAEVMLLLTADDPAEQVWSRCRPVPGSLFVVGDPKQSIYRFRRADIVTYNRVKDIISKYGMVVPLTANFRTVGPLVEWVNGAFNKEFPEAATTYSPARCPMLVGRRDEREGELNGGRVLDIPEEYDTKEKVIPYETDRIARTIRAWLDSGATVPRTALELKRGASPRVCAGDFLVVARNKNHLSQYAMALERLGIPTRVAGGSALCDARELSLLHRCLCSVTEPENPVALVAALRSELFGITDSALFDFRQSGRPFSFHAGVPDTLTEPDRVAFADAFERLRRYESWLRTLPMAAALERIAADSGLFALAASKPGGNVQSGSLAKALEILRAERSRFHSLADAVGFLSELLEGRGELDALEATAPGDSVVRIMNLHKAKGLEAPVVFLADPTGVFAHPIHIHVDREDTDSNGYMAVYADGPGNYQRLLAEPEGWEQSEEQERLFCFAEEIRLRYVAATRAGAMLVISQRQKRNSDNPWSFFETPCQVWPRLADPGPQKAPTQNLITLTTAEADLACAKLAERLSQSRQKSYLVAAAKKIGVSGQLGPSAGEHGVEWGTCIHLLLESAMRQPDVDLRETAYSNLKEHGPELAGQADLAVETAQAVMRSEIWKRARGSKHWMAEVPFELVLNPDEVEDADVPAVLRGVIDLIFLEQGGWVIVDYKTDQRGERELQSLVDHYKGQVLLYAKTWERMVLQSVREVGLYFTHFDQYVVVRAAADTLE